MIQPPNTTRRSVNQIVGPKGEAHKATATSNIWVGGSGVFSHPTDGNKITALLSGKDYFANLIEACEAATEEICILGWQVNWDAQLKPGYRLWDLLYAAASRKVMIYVMPWDDTNPIQTYDDQTKAALLNINDRLKLSGKDKRVHVLLSSSWAKKNKSYYSHHQKLVVVDRKIAFAGGIDTAYGRYDDSRYDLHSKSDGRLFLNRYNPCIPARGELLDESKKWLVDPDLMGGVYDRNGRIPFKGTKTNAQANSDLIAAGGYQVPYGDPPWHATGANSVGLGPSAESNPESYSVLHAPTQPRMPWQDLHSRIEGPAVSHLLRDFVVRWNAGSEKRLPMPPLPAAFEKPGKAHIQILRSAPAGMVAAEYKALESKVGVKAPSGTEDDIQKAMLLLIEKSSRFIYIENQFFVSAFGKEIYDGGSALSPAAQFINARHGGQQSGADLATVADEDTQKSLKRVGQTWIPDIDSSKTFLPPKNKVCEALIARIQRAILGVKHPKFHVYITLPVHPEGMLDKASVAIQVYWTMQTISFGSRSLLNGIRRALKAKELRNGGDKNFMRVVSDETSTEHESIPTDACFDYVTLLNLRNWAVLKETDAKTGKTETRYVTEQIYVHTKLMVVDDLYALFGSANINDRSLLGERDSELAMLVMDGDSLRADINGKGSKRPVRRFAHELRMGIWSKLFGITSGLRPAKGLATAIAHPGSPNSWKLIQEQAKANTALYEAAFDFIPRSASPFDSTQAASIIPTFDTNLKGLKKPMPFEDRFWQSAQFEADKVKGLDSIKGFICALPIDWSRGEYNRFSFPSMLVVDAGPMPGAEARPSNSYAAATVPTPGTVGLPS
jgi:phospholipase D1/2